MQIPIAEPPPLVVDLVVPEPPAATAIANVTDRPLVPVQPAAPAPPPAPAAGPASADAALKSAAEQSSVEEISVTASRRTSRLRGLFTREPREASAPITVVPENRDRFQHFDVNPVKRTATEPVSTFSADVDTASYSFVRRQLNDGVLPPADAVRVEEMVNYFDYAWPVPASRDTPFRPTITISDSPWGEGRKLVHIGIRGFELPAGSRPDVNLVLLLDVSGSMNSPDKLPLAQRSMALLLDSLKPTDTVAIVVYAGAAGQVLAPTPVRDRQAILEALNSLRPGGSTAGAAGIQLAYELARRNFRKEGVNRILLATDGDFNVGISDSRALRSFVEREREKGVFLSVLGFGQGNYRDEMAQALAQNGNGVAAYIDTLAEARKVLVEQAGAALFTIAKDVKLQVEFNPATVAEYRLVGYESRALNREDFNNDRVDAGDIGAGHAVTAIYEITPVGSGARFVDEPRYADSREPSSSREPTSRNATSGEYGFLKIRYKLPNGSRSRLIEAPIRANAGVPASLRQDVEFSTAVAGFAQLLRGGRYTGGLTYEEVLRQAQASRGEDEYGYRAEFVQLVRRAMQARGIP
jgi:Ca-activated chloride channel family protein